SKSANFPNYVTPSPNSPEFYSEKTSFPVRSNDDARDESTATSQWFHRENPPGIKCSIHLQAVLGRS
ncbi:hypothetical protein LINGRAHAP2_LOCUS1832, partial [Linum grandiflorum]